MLDSFFKRDGFHLELLIVIEQIFQVPIKDFWEQIKSLILLTFKD